MKDILLIKVHTQKNKIVNAYIRICELIEKQRSAIITVSAIIYKIILELYYILVISPVYCRNGLICDIGAMKYLFSWIIYLLLLYILPKSKEGMAETFLHLQFVISIAPLIVFYALANKSSSYIIMVALVVIIQTYILRRKDKNRIGISLPRMKSYMTVYMCVFIVGIYLAVLITGGFYGVEAFDLKYLYSIRQATEYSVILSYLKSWVTYSIIPFYLVYSLEKKNYVITFLLCILMILLYMTLGNKIIYLSLVVIFSVYLIAKLKVLIPSLYVGFISLCVLFGILFLLEEPFEITQVTLVGTAFLGQRFLFVPALCKYTYFECFSEFPKVGFSDGMIGKFFNLNYMYKGSMGQTAFAYLEKGRLFESNSNAGYLGDSYGQAGFIGMVLIGLLLALFVRLICNIGHNLGETLVCTLLALLVVVLNDNAFISIFLSSGWIIMILFLIVYAEPKSKVYKRSSLL